MIVVGRVADVSIQKLFSFYHYLPTNTILLVLPSTSPDKGYHVTSVNLYVFVAVLEQPY